MILKDKKADFIIQAGELKYEWIADWAQIPTFNGWAHHGIAVSKNGYIYSGHAQDPIILVFDQEGSLINEIKVPITESHCIHISEESDEEKLWIVDTAGKHNTTAEYPVQILKCDLNGVIERQLLREDFAYDDDEPFCLTSASVDPRSGDLWVSDGYGSHRVSKFNSNLKLEFTIDGSEGAAGKFENPHWVHCDTRTEDTRIYIADRTNDRIQIYDTDGQYINCLDQGFITPSAFASFDDKLIVAELNARIVILDKDDKVIGYLGEGHEYLKRNGWPNQISENGNETSPLELLKDGKFNSPHGITADLAGNIYITEWLIGDRYTKLRRL